MGLYNITGWSAGGRRPLTYNLKAGQFRGMGGVNVMPGPRNIVNIYNDGYGTYGSDDCGPKMPKWMQWMMGGGMIMNFLGQILTSIFPNHSYRGVSNPPSDGRGSTVTDSQMQNLTILRDTYSRDCTISDPLPDGTVIITGKNAVNGKYPRVSCKLDDLQTKLAELYDANGTENTEETGDKPSKDLINLAKGLGIDTNGKTAQELSDEIIKNRTNPSTATTHTQPAAATTPPTVGTGTTPAPAAATLAASGTYADLGGLIARDQSGRTQNIQGTVTPIYQKTNGVNDTTKPPQTITIKTASNNTYTFTLTGTTTKGEPIYEGGGNKYALIDGQLVNQEGSDGYGLPYRITT